MSQDTNPLALDDLIDVEAFVAEINAEIGDLTEAMRTQTARAAYYAMKHAAAKKQRGKIDNLVQATEAKLRQEHRQKLTEEALEDAEASQTKPERITKDMVDAAIFTDSRMRKLIDIQLRAIEIQDVCRVAWDAFKVRQEMLVSMGHMTRAEMQQQLRISGGEATSSVGNARARYQERLRARGQSDDNN